MGGIEQLSSYFKLLLLNMTLENGEVQPQEETTSTNDNQPNDVDASNSTIEVNGRTMTADELKKSYESLLKDHTKKSQALAESKKTENAGEYITRKELEKLTVEKKEEEDFNSSFGGLEQNKQELLKTLKKSSPEASYEDLATKFWILNEAELVRVKSNKTLVWWNKLGLPSQKQEVGLNDKIRFKHNYKTTDQRNEIRSQFWL